MFKQTMKALTLAVMASMIFYCGAALNQPANPDAQAQPDAQVADSEAPDAETEPCNEEPTYQWREIDVVLTAEATAVIPIPDWPNVIIQAYERLWSNGEPHWQPTQGSVCYGRLFTEPPSYDPNIPTPSLYFIVGHQRQCKVMIYEPVQPPEQE